MYLFSVDVFYYEFIEFHALDEIVGRELNVIILRVVKDVCFKHYGRGDIQPQTNIVHVSRQISEIERVVRFENRLFYYFVVFENFRPDFYHAHSLA